LTKTIAAVATPPGIGGISVIRLSGEKSFDIIERCFESKRKIDFTKGSRIYYGQIVDGDKKIDSVNVSIFKSPNSYTGEDTVEISCHGNSLLADIIVELLVKYGAEYAEPGEFTRRAFLNGKLDLTQAEAVADLIHSTTVPGVETAAKQLNGNFTDRLLQMRQELLDIASLLELELDFSEEGLDLIDRSVVVDKILKAVRFCSDLINAYTASEVCRAGYYTAVTGFPNSGKSTLFNTLIGRNRAIVSNIAGTTRDYLEESLYIKGLRITLADTAGLRDTDDLIEIEGIKLVESVIEQANLVIVLNDSTSGINTSDKLAETIRSRYKEKEVILIQNKCDISSIETTLSISAITGQGCEELKALIYEKAVKSISAMNDIMINSRHKQLLQSALSSLNDALSSINSDMENELIAIDIKKATNILGELTGESWNEEVLANIFSRFCIGK